MITEQQVRDAIVDFQSLIAEGWETNAAVAEAATSNGLKPSVLEHRLAKAATVESVVAEIRRNADRDRIRAAIHSAVDRYIDEGIKWFKRSPEIRREMLDRVEGALGRPSTGEEQAQADSSYKQIKEERSLQFQREQMRIVREAPAGSYSAEN